MTEHPITDPPLGGRAKAVARFALLPPPGVPPAPMALHGRGPAAPRPPGLRPLCALRRPGPGGGRSGEGGLAMGGRRWRWAAKLSTGGADPRPFPCGVIQKKLGRAKRGEGSGERAPRLSGAVGNLARRWAVRGQRIALSPPPTGWPGCPRRNGAMISASDHKKADLRLSYKNQ